MKKPFVFKLCSVAALCLFVSQAWIFNSVKSNVHLCPNTLYVITGSDWCQNCNYFEKQVLRQKEFIDYMNEIDLDLVIIDFPQRIKQTDSLVQINKTYADKLKFDGEFPSLYLVGKDTGTIIKLNYQKESAYGFIANLKLYLSND